MESLIIVIIVVIVFIVISSKLSVSKVPDPETASGTAEEQIKRKIESLEKQAKDKNIYEKCLKILSYFNKDKIVRTYYIYMDDASAMKKEDEEMNKAGIITYKKNNLIIKKEDIDLHVINEGKTVFSWKGMINSHNGRYTGLQVYSYIPGSWEKDIDQLFTKIQEEEKRLEELRSKNIEKQERERWGLN